MLGLFTPFVGARVCPRAEVHQGQLSFWCSGYRQTSSARCWGEKGQGQGQHIQEDLKLHMVLFLPQASPEWSVRLFLDGF